MPMQEQAKNAKNTNETASDLILGASLTKVKRRYCKSQALSLHNTETLLQWSPGK